MKLTKIHRAIGFKQKAWARSFIQLNTKLRAAANSDFEKSMYKLINNSIFGKSCENKRNRTTIELVTKESRAVKVVQQPRFESFQIISDNLVALKKNQFKYD